MKSKEEARANFEVSTAYIPERYKAGVGRADWATPAGSDRAETNFAAAISKAISAKRRQVNVRKVSNSEWQAQAMNKGGAIIGTRIAESMDKRFAKFGPIFDSVKADVTRLPGRTVDFRTNITNRVVGTVESWKRHSGKL